MKRLWLRTMPILLAAALFSLATPIRAQAAFTSTAGTVSTPVVAATLQPALAVLLPGGIVCGGTVRVNWTPSLSYVNLFPGYGFNGADISYTVTLTSGSYSATKTVTGGAAATVVFNQITLLGYYSATVTANYRGWTSDPTDSSVSRGCLV